MSPLEIVKAATDAINDGRIEEALEFYSDMVIQKSPATSAHPGFKIREGKEALRQVLQADGSNGVKFHHQNYIAEGDLVAVEGVNSGFINGIYVEQPVAVFYIVRGNQIAEVTVYYDRLALSKIVTPE